MNEPIPPLLLQNIPTTRAIKPINLFVGRNGVELGSLFYNLRKYLSWFLLP